MKMHHILLAQKACFRVVLCLRDSASGRWMGSLRWKAEQTKRQRQLGVSQQWLLWCQGRNIGSLPKTEVQLLKEDLPQLGTCGLPFSEEKNE